MMELPEIARRRSRRVTVGGIAIGGGAPVTVQSMTNTRTADAEATIAQICSLAEAGCDLVRVATPTPSDTAALERIVAESPIPVVADVHFHFARALEAVAAGVHKIRLNPGNIGDREQVRRVIDACAAAGVAVRVGVNEGSILDRRDERLRARQLAAGDLVTLMVDTIEQYLAAFDEAAFHQLVLSAKTPDATTCVAVNRALAERFDYPLHLGLTHAGTATTGIVRSVAALGALLSEGIGETIRISLAGDPVREVLVGRELLESLRLRERRGVEIIACPGCGRTQADVESLAESVRAALADVDQPLRVAVMGCVVNGPGEAENADVAACCGRGRADLYRRGRKVSSVSIDELVPAVVGAVRDLLAAEA
jgi:(E)-4-hydroxy-3-methylbut-2-enyl-diphosphate synthase